MQAEQRSFHWVNRPILLYVVVYQTLDRIRESAIINHILCKQLRVILSLMHNWLSNLAFRFIFEREFAVDEYRKKWRWRTKKRQNEVDNGWFNRWLNCRWNVNIIEVNLSIVNSICYTLASVCKRSEFETDDDVHWEIPFQCIATIYRININSINYDAKCCCNLQLQLSEAMQTCRKSRTAFHDILYAKLYALMAFNLVIQKNSSIWAHHFKWFGIVLVVCKTIFQIELV